MAGNLEVARNLGVLEIQVDLNFVDSKLVSEFPDCVTLKVLKNGTKTPIRLVSVLRRKRDREVYFGTDEYSMTRVRLIEGACVELFKALNSKAKGVIKEKVDEYIRGELLGGTETLIVHLDEPSIMAELRFNYNVITSGKGHKVYRPDTSQGGDWMMPGENADYPKLRVGFGTKKNDNLYGYASTTSYSYTTANINNDGMNFKAVPFNIAGAVPPVNKGIMNAAPWQWDEAGQNEDVEKIIANAKEKIKAENELAEQAKKKVPAGFFFDPAFGEPIKAEPVKPQVDDAMWFGIDPEKDAQVWDGDI